jgi:hypothetical protein
MKAKSYAAGGRPFRRVSSQPEDGPGRNNCGPQLVRGGYAVLAALARGTGHWLENQENGSHSPVGQSASASPAGWVRVSFPKVLEHPYNPVNGTAKYELHAISDECLGEHRSVGVALPALE